MTVVISCIPSPCQVALFDATAREEPDFRAVYLSRHDRSREWREADLQHEAIFLDERGRGYAALLHLMSSADLAVFADYSSGAVRDAMRHREAVGKSWCFWGERPSYSGLEWFGRIRRIVHLAPLHRNPQTPIWGFGKGAVDEYRREFGDSRLYCNCPYVSDLARFRTASARPESNGSLRILYSGALSKREGVDLLASAFRRVVRTHERMSLSVVGDGPLRPAMAQLLGSAAANTVFHDSVPQNDLPGLCAEADVLCVPSRREAWGLIVPEGMAAGLSVIATDRIGAALELIEPDKNGWLVTSGNELQLYEALRAAAELSPSRRAAMRAVAQSRASQHDISAGVQRFRDAKQATLRAWWDSRNAASMG